jgi:hypothetical protein
VPWAVAAAGITAAAGIGSSLMQKDTAESAQDAAQAQFQQQRADTEPWRTTGAQSLTANADLLGLNGPDAAARAMGNFSASPGYQWQLDQGLRAIDAGAAASGMLRSGATLKAEQEYGQGLANQDFSKYYERLYGLSQLGGNAATGGATNAAGSAQASLSGANAQNSILANSTQGLTSSANRLLDDPGFRSFVKGSGTDTVQPIWNTSNPVGTEVLNASTRNRLY